MTEVEEWRAIPGWEGLYEASSEGRIRSLDRELAVRTRHGGDAVRRNRGRLMRPSCGADGYPAIRLSRPGGGLSAKVHVLVCEAFHGPRPVGKEVAHLDGARGNNRSANLRWATRTENMHDKLVHGTQLYGDNHPTATFTLRQRAIIRKISGVSHVELAELLGTKRETISRVYQNKPTLSRPQGDP